jgi:hypothetical protein
MRLTLLALSSNKPRFDEKSCLATRNIERNRVSDHKNQIVRSTKHIAVLKRGEVWGQVLCPCPRRPMPYAHGGLCPRRPMPTEAYAHGGLCPRRPMPYAHGGLCPMPARAPHVTEKGYIICQQHTRFCIPFAAVPMLCARAWP